MSHRITCNDGVFLCFCHKCCDVKKYAFAGRRISESATKRGHLSLLHKSWQDLMSSYFLLSLRVSRLHYPPPSSFLQVAPFAEPSSERIFDAQARQLSLLPSRLILSCLCPSPPARIKRKPLLRCFARHYKTVAMDTQSEQAPHSGSRIGNDRCNISHLKKKIPLLSSVHRQTDRCVKNVKDQDLKKRCVRLLVVVREGTLERLFASCSTQVG